MKVNYRVFSKKELIAALEELDHTRSAYNINHILVNNWNKKLLKTISQLIKIDKEIDYCVKYEDIDEYARLACERDKLNKKHNRMLKLDNELFHEQEVN